MLKFNKKTGEFEEVKKRKGCGCVVAVIVLAFLAAMVLFSY